MTGGSGPTRIGPADDTRRVAVDSPGRVLSESGAVPLPAALARADEASFVGRGKALGRLHERWRGGSGFVVVAGEPGIGKTRLVARFGAEVHDSGGVVLSGRTDEVNVWPYQAFVEALRHYAAHRPGLISAASIPPASANALASLVPELGLSPTRERPGGDDERDRNRHQLFEAVVRLFLHAARPHGLLLVLEDLHWADAPTLLLLRHVLRRSEGSRVLIVATFGDRDAAAGLRGDAPLETVQLAGLAPDEAAALVAARAGPQAAGAESARRLCEETGGNPFFIEELLRADPDHREGVPAAVKQVIGRRLDRLPRSSLGILTLAAVLGNAFSLAALEAVAPDRGQDELLDALEAAVAAGLIFEDAETVDRFSFTHALVRETLYERPIASRRVRLHRQVAEALETSPLPVHPAELANHYFEARSVGGADKAILYSLEAGAAAQTAHAYEAAIGHYERVLSLLPLVGRNDPAARCDLLLALGTARWQASEPNARATFVHALELARELGSPDRMARAALGAGGRFYAPATTDFEYTELLDGILAALEPDVSLLRVRVLGRLAENLVLAHPARALTLAEESLDMARRLAEPSALAVGLMGRHAALLHVEHAPERRRIGEELLAVAGELEDAELGALARHWLLYDLAELGDLAEARRRHAELERLAGQLQQPLYRHSALAWRAVLAGVAGHFHKAERLARESLQLAEGAGAADAHMHFTAQLVAIRREQGRLGALMPTIERLAQGDAHATTWRSILPLAHLDAGDRTRARAAYDDARGDAVRTMQWLTAASALCEVAAELGDADGCASRYDELAPYADRLIQWGFSGNAGSVQRVLGRAAAGTGRWAEACEHFEAALERHAELRAPALLARTTCDYGELLLQGTQGDRRRGRELLGAAAAAARRLDLSGVAARAAAHA